MQSLSIDLTTFVHRLCSILVRSTQHRSCYSHPSTKAPWKAASSCRTATEVEDTTPMANDDHICLRSR